MPIKIPDLLPAVDVLSGENIFVMTDTRAAHQNVRPLKLLILNLMPKKIDTENQLIRLLSNSPLQVDIELLRIDQRESKNTPTQHLNSFYRSFEQVKDTNYDGMIITGAPLGLVDFEDIVYWDKIQEVIRWSQEHVTSTMFLCWAVQAALKVLFDLPKQTQDEKLSGVYKHQILTQHEPLIRGFDDQFLVPQSRNAAFPVNFITNHTDLHLLASSEEAGAYLMASACRRQVYVTGHPEYDAETLAQEFWRDSDTGLEPTVPVNYFPDDLPDNKPRNTWRSHASLLFANWLNYYVYQITPYELNK